MSPNDVQTCIFGTWQRFLDRKLWTSDKIWPSFSIIRDEKCKVLTISWIFVWKHVKNQQKTAIYDNFGKEKTKFFKINVTNEIFSHVKTCIRPTTQRCRDLQNGCFCVYSVNFLFSVFSIFHSFCGQPTSIPALSTESATKWPKRSAKQEVWHAILR